MAGARGRSGRKPKPTCLKVVTGNPGKRPVNENEIQPDDEVPVCPTWLSREAKAEWRRVVPELALLKLLAKVDRAALAAYCEAWSLLRRAEGELEKHGLLLLERTEFEDGSVVTKATRNPAAYVMTNAMAQIRAFCGEFGLTPSARSRMSTPEAPSGKGAERYLS